METLKYRVYVDEFQGGMGQYKKWIDSYHNTREEAEKRAKEIMKTDTSHWTTAYVQEGIEVYIPAHTKTVWKRVEENK